MSAPSHVLEARGLRFGYHAGQEVLRDVNLRAAAGELLCILGPNGSGKTTLLRCLLGRLQARSGQILLDARPLEKYSRRGLAKMLAYVPQTPVAAFEFTVREIILMGRFAHVGPLGIAGEHDQAVANQAMIMTDTQRFADRTLSELSGGEAQRVMIGRALAQQPQVSLLDEPTSHLDIRNQLSIYRMMQRLAHDWTMAVVCVSHDVNLASRFADRLVLMHDGGVLAEGTPEEVIRPEVLSEAYQVAVDLVPDPEGGAPLIRAK